MFSLHGYFQIDIRDHIIFVTISNAFNEQTVIMLNKEVMLAIKAFDAKPFTLLVNALSFDGATPEAYIEANNFSEWLNTQNMLGKAIVHQSNALMEIDRHYKKAIHYQNIKEFSNVKEAEQWLKSL